jgi:hypothetical protein
VPTVRLDGVEADSVIGALCASREHSEAAARASSVARESPTRSVLTIIVSSDHDFHQLVDERVRVFDDVKKTLWDVAAVKAHYRLREPREVSTYKALVGDVSDGVKGVYRCGPVTARKVCTVLRRLLREAPYLHRLSDPPDRVTARVLQSLARAGLGSVAGRLPALLRCYRLVDIPSAGLAVLRGEGQSMVTGPQRPRRALRRSLLIGWGRMRAPQHGATTGGARLLVVRYLVERHRFTLIAVREVPAVCRRPCCSFRTCMSIISAPTVACWRTAPIAGLPTPWECWIP